MAKNQARKNRAGMRAAGRLACQLLDALDNIIVPGISTEYIDRIVDKLTSEAGALSGPFMYGPVHNKFPKHCCTSVNDVVCHGIPSESVILSEGDIVNVDVTPKLNGYHGDSSRMFKVGDVSEKNELLIAATFLALQKGIQACYPNCPITVVADAIQPFAESHGFSVVKHYTGHGIGKTFHKPPFIFHCRLDPAIEQKMFPEDIPLLKPGMTFTIEPMLNAGIPETIELEDGWTVVTQDGTNSAQWEHTLLMTNEGVEILTEL